MGLFGSPHTMSNMWNGWMDVAGNLISVPTSWSWNVAGTPYWNNNWKATSPSLYYLTYEAGIRQADIETCDAGDWNENAVRLLIPKDVSPLSDEVVDGSVRLGTRAYVAPRGYEDNETVRDIWGEMPDCLMDGRLGWLSGAHAFHSPEVETRQNFTAFRRIRHKTKPLSVE